MVDPIPPVNGDNIEERFDALARHLYKGACRLLEFSEADLLAGISLAITCPHEEARARQPYAQHIPDYKLQAVLCHDCKALMLAHEAKHRGETEDIGNPAGMSAVSEAARREVERL